MKGCEMQSIMATLQMEMYNIDGLGLPCLLGMPKHFGHIMMYEGPVLWYWRAKDVSSVGSDRNVLFTSKVGVLA